MSELTDLGKDECERLLRGGVVGRVALSTPDGPHIVPVNYSVMGDRVVFRTTPYSVLGTYGRGAQLAFEVDEFDDESHLGWSVVARGRGDAITDPDVVGEVNKVSPPVSWAAGQRTLYVGLRWSELTGRRLGSGITATPGDLDDPSPTRR